MTCLLYTSSEVYFDRGPEYGCGKPDCKPGCDCDRYLEFWNHVFTQFSKEEDGSYTPLEHPNIDTGMGLERMACIMQGVDSIFDVDTIRHILDGVVAMSGVKYEDGAAKTDVSIRIITDHLRSMVLSLIHILSTGSACSSKSLEPSHVLSALGVPVEMIHGTVRFTVGDFTTKEDIDYVVENLKEVVTKLRELSPVNSEKGW